MKKFLLPLAISFGISSALAFNVPETNSIFKIYGLPPLTYSSAPSVAQAESGTLVRDNQFSNFSISTTFVLSSANDGCSSNVSFLCAAEVESFNGSKTISETATGNFFSF